MHRGVGSAVVLVCASVACAPGLQASNGAKLGEALAWAAAAGAAQVAESVAEQHARNNAPVTHASGGVSASPDCDNEGQYGCLSVTSWPSGGDPARPASASPEMGADEAHDYVLGYVNGVRKLNGLNPVVRDEQLDAFAQAGSDELALDHRANQHLVDHARELPGGGEIQGNPSGSSPGPLQDRIGAILLHVTGEGPGGIDHDVMLRPAWRKVGIGIATSDGRVYFTLDFAS